MTVRFKKLDARAVAPTYGSKGAAAADLRAMLDTPAIILPHESLLIHTGIAVSVPHGYAGLIYARSGIACKRNLAPGNCVGVLDEDYVGEVMVCLHNHGEKSQVVEPGERIAQLMIAPCARGEFVEVDELDDTERGAGGFGSTGTK